MPTQEEIKEANIPDLLALVKGAGDYAMMNMISAANIDVMSKVSRSQDGLSINKIQKHKNYIDLHQS